MTANMTKIGSPKKEKVTVSLDSELLHVIDSFVEMSKNSEVSRSSVVEQALQLWKQEMRNQYDELYYQENEEALADPAWDAFMTRALNDVMNELSAEEKSAL